MLTDQRSKLLKTRLKYYSGIAKKKKLCPYSYRYFNNNNNNIFHGVTRLTVVKMSNVKKTLSFVFYQIKNKIKKYDIIILRETNRRVDQVNYIV